MQFCKNRNRQRFCHFTTSRNRRIHLQTDVETQTKKAFAKGSFIRDRLAFQFFRVSCQTSSIYGLSVDQLREAVEYLKTQPQTKYTGLQATTSTTRKLLAQPILPLDEIIGKTPREVWAAVEVDKCRKCLLRATGETPAKT